MDNTFERLVSQIDDFIRKYYTNEIVKGIFFFLGILIFSYLFVSILEYLGRFNSLFRAFFLFGFLSFNTFILVKYILIPLGKLFSFGNRINRNQASEIIGKFFPSISDRLKNTLQLNDLLISQEGNLELLNATVYQRSQELNTVPFVGAIEIKDNKKYLKFIIPLVLLLVSISIFIPTILTQGTERVVNFNKEYKPIAPFNFSIDNKYLLLEDGEDVKMYLTLKGSFLPETVYLVCVNGKFLMEKTSKNSFVAIIKKPKTSGNFYFIANEYESDKFNYKLLGKSIIGKLDATLIYPAYLGKVNSLITNTGDITVPEGTKIEWSILTRNTKKTVLLFNNENTIIIFKKNDN